MELHPRTRWLVAGAALILLGGSLAACGDDGDDEDTTQDTTEEITETADDTASAEATSEAITAGGEVCEAYGRVQEPGGVEEVLAMMTEDVVITDIVIGADLTGKEAVRGYLTSDLFAGIDTSQCGAAIGRGDWMAGSYNLVDSSTGEAGVGIAAFHVTDGLIDRQVNHYTSTPSGAPPPSEETVSAGDGIGYCHAWDDGADVDEILSYMSDEPIMVVTEPVTGTEAVRTFVESFDFDENDCDDEAIENGEWGAEASGFTNTTTGVGIEGVSVVHWEGGKVSEHYIYFDPVG